MAYRIDYQSVRKLHHMAGNRNRRTALTAVLFLLFLTAVWCFWEEGKTVLQGMLFSGDPDVTAAAMEHFTHQLTDGVSVKAAFIEFCKDILEGS